MALPAILGIGASLIGARSQRKAANSAAAAQTASAQAGIDEQRRQFDTVVDLLSPFTEAGTSAVGGQLALAGLSGDEAQQEAIQRIEQGPQFQALTQAGEQGILQNAAATGGLRGGNTQAALAQFRPQVLSSLINQQFSNLGGLAGLGQASAAGTAAAAQNTGSNVAALLGQQGAAQAGGALARGQASANLASQVAGGLAQGFGNIGGGGGGGGFGSSPIFDGAFGGSSGLGIGF